MKDFTGLELIIPLRYLSEKYSLPRKFTFFILKALFSLISNIKFTWESFKISSFELTDVSLKPIERYEFFKVWISLRIIFLSIKVSDCDDNTLNKDSSSIRILLLI